MSTALAVGRQAWISARILWEAPFVVRFRGVLQALLATLLLATLRFRLQPRLQAAGLSLRWNVQSLPALEWLSPGNSLHVLRIVQEVVSNIIKHARAGEIRFATQADEHGVAVCIEDDGQSFVCSGQAPANGGRGVGNILSRARALGGQVRWEAGVQGAGTRFSLWLPLQGPARVGLSAQADARGT